MITAASLKSRTSKELGQLAKKKGVTGWHAMRKDELVSAIMREVRKAERKKAARTSASKSTKAKPRSAKPAAGKTNSRATAATSAASANRTNGKSKSAVAKSSATRTSRLKAAGHATSAGAKASAKAATGKVRARVDQATGNARRATARATSTETRNGKASRTRKPAPSLPPTSPKVLRRIRSANENREKLRDLTTRPRGRQTSPTKDRIVLIVRDAYWLQAHWELQRSTIERAQVALAEQWHTAIPVLRLIEIEDTVTTNTAERIVRDIEIHGEVSDWYIDVPTPSTAYRVTIGYKTATGQFHCLSRSNKVVTPSPGSSDAIDENWTDIAENCEKIFAMSGGYDADSSDGELRELFEERLRRPMGSPVVTSYGVGADSMLNRKRDFRFEVDAEMIIYGSTQPNAYVTLGGEPVKLRQDGTFTVRLSMPDRRQVLPVVASSADGVEQHTTVLAVERNTKVMEPLIRESNESS